MHRTYGFRRINVLNKNLLMRIKTINQVCIIILLLLTVSCSEKDNKRKNDIELRFSTEGTFKIVQFTDIHWKTGSENCFVTLDILETVLATEKPDLVVFTGDIVCSEPQKEAWDYMLDPVVSRGIPWAIALGNHDDEFDMHRKDIIPYLESMPCFVGMNGLEDVSGYGNYILSVKSSKGENTAANLYIFDSHAYVDDNKYGIYDWIKIDQIQWYREHSQLNKQKNKNIVLPSLAFFHIPLPEYSEMYDSGSGKIVGEKNEGVASAKVNSGLFCSFVEMGDVMGVSVGHDHNNDYIGVWKGIALAYGRVSGLDAYGSKSRGGRVFELQEGSFSFKTWIRTKSGKEHNYFYPDNDLVPTDSTVFLPAVSIKGEENGVNYEYFEGKYDSAIEILEDSVLEKGSLKNFYLEPAKAEDYFGFVFRSHIKVPEKGIYKFTLTSDDGAILYIDEVEVVNNDGSHSVSLKLGYIALEKGYHKINMLYFDDYDNNELQIAMTGLRCDYENIPDSILYIK